MSPAKTNIESAPLTASEAVPPTLLTVHQALVAVMNDVGAVGKDSRNQQQNFNFRGIDAVVNAVQPALRKHGVLVYPKVVSIDYHEITTKAGGAAVSVRGIVDYTFIGPDGSGLTTTVAAEAFDVGDKGTAKFMSVAFRTALLQTLTLPTDEKDPDEDTYERAPAPLRGRALKNAIAATYQRNTEPSVIQSDIAAFTGKDFAQVTEDDLREFLDNRRAEASGQAADRAFGGEQA